MQAIFPGWLILYTTAFEEPLRTSLEVIAIVKSLHCSFMLTPALQLITVCSFDLLYPTKCSSSWRKNVPSICGILLDLSTIGFTRDFWSSEVCLMLLLSLDSWHHQICAMLHAKQFFDSYAWQCISKHLWFHYLDQYCGLTILIRAYLNNSWSKKSFNTSWVFLKNWQKVEKRKLIIPCIQCLFRDQLLKAWHTASLILGIKGTFTNIISRLKFKGNV